MKVTLAPIESDGPDGWLVELEVEKKTTVGEFKAKLAELPDAPQVTKTSRIIFKSTQGPMYALRDNEQVKKRMLFADTSQPAPSPKAPVSSPPAGTQHVQEPPVAAPAPAPALPRSPVAKAAQPERQTLLKTPAKPAKQQAPLDLHKSLEQDLAAASWMSFPYFDQMTNSQKDRIVTKLQSCWPRQFDHLVEMKAPWYRSAQQVSEILRSQSLMMKPGQAYLVNITQTAFGLSPDLLEPGQSGYPHAHESILYMADEIFRRFRPILLKHGFGDNLAGYLDMDRAINAHIQSPEVLEMMGRTWFMLTFGSHADRTSANANVHNIIYMGIQTPVAQLVTTAQSYLHHLGLPPLVRRQRSGPRTIALAEVLLHPIISLRARRATGVKGALRRVAWVLGAEDDVEGKQARDGYFEDSAAFLQGGEPMTIFLVGRGFSGNWPVGKHVSVHARTWQELYDGALPEPEMVMMFNTSLGTLELEPMARWLPMLADLLAYPSDHAPAVVLTSRCRDEVLGEDTLLAYLGAQVCLPSLHHKHIRNLYSGSAGDPHIDYDDNGWMIVVSGSRLDRARLMELAGDPEGVCKAVGKQVEALRARAAAAAAASQETAKKTPAVYWGILDLKYDPDQALSARIKVLETGDGRSSRFSGYGATILENFRHDNKLEETLRRAVLVENKKLTHDMIVECGYSHLRPQQECYPRAYSEDLADCIRSALHLEQDDDICVLKLPNRTRGAGVIPLRSSELDEALRVLLNPPEDIEAWLRTRDESWAREVSWGCFEEQLRHWWSNESPCFLVEEFCRSRAIRKEIEDGTTLPFDGTMRVGFSLHREPEEKLPPGWVVSDNGPAYVGGEDVGPSDPVPQDPGQQRPCQSLFPSGSDVLRLQWLGGYWKLPVEDVASSDLRGRVVSVAKRGTAPVPPAHLHEVYAGLGDMVALVFNAKDISHSSLLKRYSAFPELGAFVTGRLACSMRVRDRERSKQILKLAQAIVSNLKGVPKDLVASYIERNQGVMEALYGRWKSAADLFRKSLTAMPANATSRFLLGFSHLELGDPAAAITAMEESLQLDPDFKAPYVNIGVAWLRLRGYERAIEVCQALDKRHPNTPQCLYNIGVAKYALACREEDNAGSPISTKLRSEALAKLEFARDNIGKDGPWNSRDDEMVAELRDNTQRLSADPDRLPRDGWRFYGWRP